MIVIQSSRLDFNYRENGYCLLMFLRWGILIIIIIF